MPISAKDREFMEKVAKHYRETASGKDANGSIRDTALKFEINRNKVRKILITMGEIESPYTEAAVAFRRKGKSIKEIAAILGVSTATISTALPYEDKIDNSLEPSKHASDVREYRAYEKAQIERQTSRNRSEEIAEADRRGESEMNDNTETTKEWEKDIGMSYKKTYHRPHRITWEDMEQMRKEMEEDPELVGSYAMRELLKQIEVDKEKELIQEQEWESLQKKETLTEEEQIRVDELSQSMGHFPGALNSRNKKALEKIAGDRLPPEPMSVLRLHLELDPEYLNDATIETLKEYGGLQYGRCISRDIVVPEDLPLYALHYVIQRAFGWQNSHLHKFYLPEDRFVELVHDNASMWTCLVGVLFRSPGMNEDDEFWADDYIGGSFRNWLKKKYTGPYMSQCHGEGLLPCQEDMMRLDMNEEYYLLYVRTKDYETGEYDTEEYLADVWPVYDWEGKKRPEPKYIFDENAPTRVETVPFEAIPAKGLRFVFEQGTMNLLERLPISAVLAAGHNELPESASGEEREYIDEQICLTGRDVYERVYGYIRNIIDEQIDSPHAQVSAPPVTDTLYYNYDFGDNWILKITASENCPDLVESGRITQSELDRANVKCREVYRPVLIARDGEMLMDDVGGIHGFATFLEETHPDLSGMEPCEKERAKAEKKEWLTWAKGMGWKKDKSTDFALL